MCSPRLDTEYEPWKPVRPPKTGTSTRRVAHVKNFPLRSVSDFGFHFRLSFPVARFFLSPGSWLLVDRSLLIQEQEPVCLEHAGEWGLGSRPLISVGVGWRSVVRSAFEHFKVALEISLIEKGSKPTAAAILIRK